MALKDIKADNFEDIKIGKYCKHFCILEVLPSKSTTCMEFALTQRVKDIFMTINVNQFFIAMKSEKGHSSLPDCYRFSLVKDKASLSLGNMAKLGALTGLYLEGIGASCYNDDDNDDN